MPTSFVGKEITAQETSDYFLCYPVESNGVCGASTGPGGGWVEHVTQVNDSYDLKQVNLKQQQSNPSQYLGGGWQTTITGTEHHERTYVDSQGVSHDCQWTSTLKADPTMPAAGQLTLQTGANPPASLGVGAGALVTSIIQPGSDCGTYDGFHIGPDPTESEVLIFQGSYDPTSQTVSLNSGTCFHVPPSIGTGAAGGGSACIVTGTLKSPTPDIFDGTLNKTVTGGTQNVLTGTGITLSVHGASDWTNPQWMIDGSSTPPESIAVKDYLLTDGCCAGGLQPTALGSSDLQGLSAHFFLVAPGQHVVSFTGTDPATGKPQTLSTTYNVEAPRPQASPQACPYFSVALSGTEGYIMVLTQTPDPKRPAYLVTPFGLPEPACTSPALSPYDYKVTWSLSSLPRADTGYPQGGDLQISQLINHNAVRIFYGAKTPVYTMAPGVFDLDSGPFFSHLVGSEEQSGPVPAPGPITSFDRPSLAILPQPSAQNALVYAMLADGAVHGGSASDQIDLRTNLEFKAGGAGADSIWVSLGYVELSYAGTEHNLLMAPITPTLTPLQNNVGLLTAPGILNNIAPSQPAVGKAKQSSTSWGEGNRQAHTAQTSRARVGTTFTFSLDEQANVTFVFAHPRRGRAVGRRCVAQTQHNRGKPKCVQPNAVGILQFAGHPGTNQLRFQGRLPSGRWLKPGRYTVLILASTAGGISGQTLTFTIVKH